MPLHPSLVAVYNEEKAKELKTKLADTDIRVVSGMDGLIEAATLPEADVVVTAVGRHGGTAADDGSH